MKKLFLLLSIVIYSFGAKDFVSPDVAIKPSAEIKQNSIDIKLSLMKNSTTNKLIEKFSIGIKYDKYPRYRYRRGN
ncbi:MAG: hypothetical protein WCY75_05830 [Sulfurimonadaceae bacterium]